MYGLELVLFLLGSFIITYIVIPKVINVVHYRQLHDDPNERSSHNKNTPTLGGIAFYFTFSIALFFLAKWDTSAIINSLVPGLTILFIIGLKDDLVSVSPLTKILAQITAIAFLLSNNDLLITSLNGFLGIYEIHYITSYVISTLFMLSIINSFNLIDGIDGLAAGIGIIVCSLFSILFFLTDQLFYSFISIVLVGVLVAFLFYNLSDRKKIFMGDTGSLIIGFLISFLCIKLLSTKPVMLEPLPFIVENLPIIVGAAIIIPLFDTVSVFIIRTTTGKRFFEADRNHIHHTFLEFGYSHRRVSFIISLISLIFFGLIFFVSQFFNSFVVFFASLVFLFLVGFILYNIRQNVKQPKIPASLLQRIFKIFF
ncbi:MAG: undecaprenyl/decaprenyl-phosphate alpha-N-acetylglucosaminyl 1-phosphate transferase [Flavobacteriaceae bacterium]